MGWRRKEKKERRWWEREKKEKGKGKRLGSKEPRFRTDSKAELELILVASRYDDVVDLYGRLADWLDVSGWARRVSDIPLAPCDRAASRAEAVVVLRWVDRWPDDRAYLWKYPCQTSNVMVEVHWLWPWGRKNSGDGRLCWRYCVKNWKKKK